MNNEVMFSKKPLNVLCASCDGNVNTNQSKRADYLEWNKFPQSSPSPMRIADYGTG